VTVAPRTSLCDERQMDNGTHEPLKKSFMTHLKPWSASCVALWKGKDAKSKPTPTCVRRNNPGSQGMHCPREVRSRRSLPRERVSRRAASRRIFSSQQISPPQDRSFPPVTPRRRALPAHGTLSRSHAVAAAIAPCRKNHRNDVGTDAMNIRRRGRKHFGMS